MRSVVLFHDGNTDSHLLSQYIRKHERDLDLKGIIIVSADSIGPEAVEIAHKIQKFVGNDHTPIGLSKSRGINDFPWEWKKECLKVKEIDSLKTERILNMPLKNGDKLLRDILESNDNVTILAVCPLTPLKSVLKKTPCLAKKISELIWMGGAIDIPGNVSKEVTGIDHPKSEWNIFWDSKSVKWIFKKTDFPITIVPTDPSAEAIITKELLDDFKKHKDSSPVAKLAWEIYTLVADLPYYRLWNTVATLYLLNPELFEKVQSMNLKVNAKYGSKEGSVENYSEGRLVQVALKIKNISDFYRYFIQTVS